MKALALLTLLLVVGKVVAISLTQLWTFKAGGGIEGLAFSDSGYLGIASGGCACILDPNGNLVSKCTTETT